MKNHWIPIVILGVTLLTGCGEPAPEISTPMATVAPFNDRTRSTSAGSVVASGQLVPANKVDLSFSQSGRIKTLNVQVGDRVKIGDPLVELDTGLFESDLAQAEAALAIAQTRLEAALVGATPQELQAADGAVQAARGSVAMAQANLEIIESENEFAILSAQTTISQAEGTLDMTLSNLAQCNADYSRIQEGSRPEEIAIYQAQLARAQAELWYPANIHDDLVDKGVGGVPEEQARFIMLAAQGSRDVAKAQLDLALAGPSGSELAAAMARIAAAQAQVTVAQTNVDSAEIALARVQNSAGDLAAAMAQLEIAQGQLIQAEAERDRLEFGATTETLAQLQAQVTQAEAALKKTQLALEQTTIRAPFDGTIARINANPGEVILSGQIVLTLADLDNIRVETTDLGERDIDQVAPSQPAIVFVEAINTDIAGQVLIIEPQAETLGGDVVFKVILALNDEVPDLLWGMSVEIEIQTD